MDTRGDFHEVDTQLIDSRTILEALVCLSSCLTGRAVSIGSSQLNIGSVDHYREDENILIICPEQLKFHVGMNRLQADKKTNVHLKQTPI